MSEQSAVPAETEATGSDVGASAIGERRRALREESGGRSTRRRPHDGAKEGSLWTYLRVSLSIAVFIGLLALAAAVIVVPMMTGSTALTVLTSSMEPKYPPGTLVVIEPVDASEIRIGDVVTYQLRSGDPTVVTHRVIQVSKSAGGEYSFIVQGDNNSQPDPDPIREVQIQGRLWYSVPLIGWVNTWINGEGRAFIVPLLAGGLLAYAAWMVVSGIRDKARKKKPAA